MVRAPRARDWAKAPLAQNKKRCAGTSGALTARPPPKPAAKDRPLASERSAARGHGRLSAAEEEEPEPRHERSPPRGRSPWRATEGARPRAPRSARGGGRSGCLRARAPFGGAHKRGGGALETTGRFYTGGSERRRAQVAVPARAESARCDCPRGGRAKKRRSCISKLSVCVLW
ncbi:unnamed protein product [Prorocentrum cordatum]|uniref:Uncharacterized protein n=1 Tax=Prorocentrum cordatum TaxID=2364126 RepID=A0ABN9W967_9DINO|nr:unnamed protein product [Polarella glacialis]